MPHRLLLPTLDARVRAAWQTQLAAAVKTLGLLQELIQKRADLLPRFAVQYQQLRALPRRVRRMLQRQWKLSLAGVAIMLAVGQGPALAATINVTGGCTLVDAITAANSDTTTGGCPAGSGADTIVLQSGSVHTLTSVNNTTYGPNGLPVVNSTITIEGNGSIITRSSADPFRILTIRNDGILELQNTTVSGGSVSGGGGGIGNSGMLTLNNSTVSGNTAGGGGGVSNGGSLTLNNSTVSDNFASRGGGVLNSSFGSLTLSNSTVSGNFASHRGGGVLNSSFGSSTLSNSTVAGNIASEFGGGVDNFSGSLTLSNSTVSGNISGLGGGMIIANGSLTLSNSTVSGNSAKGRGGGVFNTSGSLTLSNSTVSGNSADLRGGGVYNYIGSLTLARTMVSGNTAGGAGAEVYNFRSTVTATNFNLLGHSALSNAQAFSGFSPSGSDLTATSDGTIPTALSSILSAPWPITAGQLRLMLL